MISFALESVTSQEARMRQKVQCLCWTWTHMGHSCLCVCDSVKCFIFRKTIRTQSRRVLEIVKEGKNKLKIFKPGMMSLSLWKHFSPLSLPLQPSIGDFGTQSQYCPPLLMCSAPVSPSSIGEKERQFTSVFSLLGTV